MTTENKRFWEDPYEGNNWNKYIIEAPTHRAAAKEAANRNWWLHSWKWVEGNEVRVYVNELYLINEIPNARFMDNFKDQKWDGNGRNYRL
jgi:hypothetical protein